jgi:NAD(P)-dependent dehydrogenase (short-subunit alcohol dehydrogenase family)
MGLEIAKALAATGCDLALVDISPTKLEAAQAQCQAVHPDRVVSTHSCDVSDKDKTRDLVREVTFRHKCANRTLLLFNNAGIGGGTSIVTSSEADFDRVMDIDWGGVYNCTRSFLPLMMAAPAAHVINTSSICGFFAQIGYLKPNVSYSAAKFAVRGFTLGLLADFKLNAPHIRASCVMPGWIGTGLIDSSQQIFDNSTKAVIAGRRSASVRLRARIAELKAERDPTTLILQNENLLVALGDVDLEQYEDDELMQMLTFLGPGFRANAPTTARQAAEIILRGVAADEWNILVGEDAHSLARLVREDEEALYDDGTVVPDFFNYENWKMNRMKRRVGSGVREKMKSKI